MSFGIYVHIPYCLQRCLYCDFATYEQSKIMPPEKYVSLLKKEIDLRHTLFGGRDLDTLYFGGGTPSLLAADLIIDIILYLEKRGFARKNSCETTIEINPATVDARKLDLYLENKINRFSVGAQTFDDTLLKMVHREHSAQQTRETLRLLRDRELNYNFDLLFALPKQSRDGLAKDLDVVGEHSPPHLSPYCLTVPSGHVLSKNRPLEEDQIEMFEMVDRALLLLGHNRYEISNYAKAGFESKHNLLYWTDAPYWGLGLSSHSYLPERQSDSIWGVRFWNPKSIDDYEKSLRAQEARPLTNIENLPPPLRENLTLADSLSDFCHTSLRLSRGLLKKDLLRKFGQPCLGAVSERLGPEVIKGRVSASSDGWALTREGIHTSNFVIESVFFQQNDLELRALPRFGER
jgi:oxygen-independent coproporphyrinogen-3 oxidase